MSKRFLVHEPIREKHFDFSIVIPTFNRSILVKKAILSILRQNKVSIEVIVIDDFSRDDTGQVINAISDNRIKYIRNKKRIGYARNVKKGFNKASGDYIFTLGDDDFVLDENTLFNVLKVMKKYNVGMGRIGFVIFDKSPIAPLTINIFSEKLIILSPKKDKEVLLKMFDMKLEFYSGLIFDNRLINKNKLINHMCYPYMSLAFDVVQKYGIAYIPDYLVVGQKSHQMVPIYFNLERLGSFFLEDFLNIVKEYIYDNEYIKYKKMFLQKSMILLPNIKYLSNNKNYFNILKRLLNIDKSLLGNPSFILFGLLGFLPKLILKKIRDLKVHQVQQETFKAVKKYNYFQKINNGFI